MASIDTNRQTIAANTSHTTVTNNDLEMSLNGTDFEKDLLLSEERLDRASPDLWPEQIPGVTEFLANSSPPLFDQKSQTSEWLTDLDPDDINMLHGFGSLTASALLEKVKELQNLSYQLGLEEAREMTRGKFLNVLQTRPKRHKR
ncbi:protein lin-52 homolog [Oppia nitens]|uniref:protein lin-52 homolog n=1 Tax=Oppia nitens TaxID=1686743 RepID=UPI0023DB335E|nr:protein lin-52 homolog [Oppia nitens]